MTIMETYARWAEGAGLEESNVCVPLAAAPGVRQVRTEGSESDDKEVTAVDFAGISLTSPAALSLGISLFSHGGIDGCESEGANLEASLNDFSYVTGSSSSVCVCVCMCACVRVWGMCSPLLVLGVQGLSQ